MLLFYRFYAIVILLSLISACANTPHFATAHYFRHFNFSQLKSYALYDRNSEFLDYQNMSDVMRNSIEFAIETQLDAKKLVLHSADKADVMVSYFWVPIASEKSEQPTMRHGRRNSQSREQSQYNNDHEFNTLGHNGFHGDKLAKYNRDVHYCGACLLMSNDGNKEVKIATDPGALIIDFINPKTKRSVWRSSFPVIIKDKENSQALQTKIKRAVKEMLLQYPKN